MLGTINLSITIILVLGCDDDVSLDEEDMKHSTLENRNEISDNNHDIDPRQGNLNKISLTSEKSGKRKTDHHYDDDIRIIDLESRGEGSVSPYGRSTSDSPHEIFSPAITNGIPSNSASYTDNDKETSSQHSGHSSTCSPIESPPR